MTRRSPVRVVLSVLMPIPMYLLGKGVSVSLTYERPSAPALNGRSTTAPTSEFTTQPIRRGTYTAEEISVRTGVPRAVLVVLSASGAAPDERDGYAAVDVVRLAVLDHLMRSGVPVARAAALVQAAERVADTAIRAGQAFPNSGVRVQTGSEMTAGH